MNWDRMEVEWKQRRGKAVHHWGKMMNDELAAIAGKYEELVGKLQEKYGIAKEEADQQVKDFTKTIGQLRKSNDHLVQLQVSSRNKQRAGRKRLSAGNPSRKTNRSKARD
jgi:uncharacterized protein YjbJ (UPF0337 family)